MGTLSIPLRARGFTLIELMVVLVIAGILISMVSMSVGGGSERALRFEAERLAHLLSLAREEAQVRGVQIRFNADAQRYRFLALRDRQWQAIANEPDLRERAWEAPTQVSLLRADGRSDVEFGRDAVDAPFALILQRDQRTARIDANGLGNFVVESGRAQAAAP